MMYCMSLSLQFKFFVYFIIWGVFDQVLFEKLLRVIRGLVNEFFDTLWLIDINILTGQPLTKNKIKPVYEKEQKGPITAVDAVNGFLVATVGQKIYIFQFKNQDLLGVAFIDSQIYIHTLCCMKSFILVGDVMKSIDLLQFQEDYRTLAVISRDPRYSKIG